MFINGRARGLDLRLVGKANKGTTLRALLPGFNPRQILKSESRSAGDAVELIRANAATVDVVHLADTAPLALVKALGLLQSTHLTVTITALRHRSWDPPKGRALGASWQRIEALVSSLGNLGKRLKALEIIGYGQPPHAVLGKVARLRSLRILWLVVDSLDREGVEQVAALPKLRRLLLGPAAGLRVIANGTLRYKHSTIPPLVLGPDALAPLSSMRRLVSLDLGRTTVKGRDLRPVSALKQLKELYVDFNPGIDDAALKHLAPLTKLRHLALGSTAITGAGLVHLKPLVHLESLGLRRVELVKGAFGHLVALRALRWLDLQDCGWEGRGDGPSAKGFFVGVGRLRKLQYLDLRGSRAIQAAELAAIGRLHKLRHLAVEELDHRLDLSPLAALAELRSLDLGFIDHPVGGLRPLAKLRRLRVFSLIGSGRSGGASYHAGLIDPGNLAGLVALERLRLTSVVIRPGTMKRLGNPPRLKHLVLQESRIANSDLAHVAGLTGLRTLKLSGCPVSDPGLAHLHRATGLRYIDVSETAISPKGLRALRRMLPHCYVRYAW